MPSVAVISKIDFPHKLPQSFVKDYVRKNFGPHFPFIDKIIDAFDHAAINERNFCQPLEYYLRDHTFPEQNGEYIRIALEYSMKAITECTSSAGIKPSEITDIIFVSTTGLATPSLDALIINAMH